MKFRNEYAKFNDFYYSSLNNLIERSKINDISAKEFLDESLTRGVDFDTALYKLLIDEEEEVIIDSNKYKLLSIGLKNSNILSDFVSDEYHEQHTYPPRVTINTFKEIFFHPPKFESLYYPEYLIKPSDESFKRCCDAYIKHYRDTLGEIWSEKDFYKMLNELQYLTVKYAIDTNTNELFPVGFFGASVRSGAGGKCLTNAELFVMPEFRRLGIAQKMVGVSLYQAKEDGIENFDSITYRTAPTNALAFWEKVGASVSGLIHIEGSIPEMLDVIDKNYNNKKSL